LKVCLVGGIYDKPSEYRRVVPHTPETTLEAGLVARGHKVITAGLRRPVVFGNSDVIHVHHLGRGAIAIASDPTQTPFVFTNHGGGRSKLMGRALAAVLARADGVVALSQGEARSQQRRYFLRGAVHASIPNGVDAGRFEPRQPGIPKQGEPWRLLFAGQLIGVKRVDLLLEALGKLRGRFRIHLKLAYHNDTYLQSLRSRTQALGIDSMVEFAGPLCQDDLAKAYREAHVLVLPSDSESLPSVVTESMMSGTPVVATDVGSVREQLAGFGVVVPSGSVDRLAAGIESMLSDYGGYASRALIMSQSARDRFSVDAMVSAHEDLYRNLVSRRLARRHSRRNLVGTHLLSGALRVWRRAKP
jgi:glycosyltransferase involved in cell wall biosynthesis